VAVVRPAAMALRTSSMVKFFKPSTVKPCLQNV
jgi:hypothetical protein